MKVATDKAICAILGGDETITERQAQKALSILRGEAAEVTAGEILTRGEVAKMFGVTKTTITNWKRRGALHPVKIGNSAFGYLRADVERLFKTAV